MTTTVSAAVATRDTGPESIVRSYTDSFAEILPRTAVPNAGAWVGLVIGALRRDRNLMSVAQRNPASLMNALVQCARYGLEPGTEQFWLVPFGQEVTGIVGWQGHLELIHRAGAVSSVKAEVVREHDVFEFKPSDEKPRHEVDWFGDRGDLKGVYAYAVLKDGTTSKVVVLGRSYIDKVKANSRGSSSSSSPWQKWEEQMWLKTAVKNLSKWIPTSAEHRAEMMHSTAAAMTTAPQADLTDHHESLSHVDADTGEVVVEGELIDEEPPGWENP